MEHFLAERYLAGADRATLAEEAWRLNASGARDARLLLTLYLAEDESCLYLFEAESVAGVQRASRENGLVLDRVAAEVTIVSQTDGT